MPQAVRIMAGDDGRSPRDVLVGNFGSAVAETQSLAKEYWGDEAHKLIANERFIKNVSTTATADGLKIPTSFSQQTSKNEISAPSLETIQLEAKARHKEERNNKIFRMVFGVVVTMIVLGGASIAFSIGGGTRDAQKEAKTLQEMRQNKNAKGENTEGAPYTINNAQLESRYSKPLCQKIARELARLGEKATINGKSLVPDSCHMTVNTIKISL